MKPCKMHRGMENQKEEEAEGYHELRGTIIKKVDIITARRLNWKSTESNTRKENGI